MLTFHRHSFHHKLNKRNTIMSRETLFSLLCWRTVGVDDRNRCVCRAPAEPLPLFFPANSPLLGVPEATSWHTEQLSEGQGRQMGVQKATQFSKQKATRGLHRVACTSVNFLNQFLYTHSCLSHLAVTVMPKPDFTSRPERMSSCFPHGLRRGKSF